MYRLHSKLLTASIYIINYIVNVPTYRAHNFTNVETYVKYSKLLHLDY